MYSVIFVKVENLHSSSIYVQSMAFVNDTRVVENFTYTTLRFIAYLYKRSLARLITHVALRQRLSYFIDACKI